MDTSMQGAQCADLLFFPRLSFLGMPFFFFFFFFFPFSGLTTASTARCGVRFKKTLHFDTLGFYSTTLGVGVCVPMQWEALESRYLGGTFSRIELIMQLFFPIVFYAFSYLFIGTISGSAAAGSGTRI
ncbi:hypothetical protein F4781DRAFT_139591 [Annulohypoxylon bovei var. microspora]|nr:hypothetical protein F4781DRAFT_139591 [Annulohypoxylon bovei var. microspora]